MVTRSGHSLPELIVALTVFTLLLGGVAAATTTARRLTIRAEARQEAVRTAARTLDSLIAAPDAAAGERISSRWRTTWTVDPEGSAQMVRVRTVPSAARDTGVFLEALRVPAPPLLPAPGPDGGSEGATSPTAGYP